MSLPPMSAVMTGGMILVMAVLMILVMFAVHAMRTNHLRRHRRSSHGPSGALSLFSWGITVLLRLGIRVTILGPMMLLTVRGRKTGQPRTVPVDVHEHDGHRFLMATHGEGHWVRNLHVAGGGILSLGRRHQAFTAVELAPEQAGPVIKEVLGPLLASRGIRGNALRQHLGVRADSPLDEFVAVARTHPVFELDFSTGSSSAGAEHQETAGNSTHDRTGTYAHERGHIHEYRHARGLPGWRVNAIPFLHGHSHGEAQIDQAMESNARGVWAIKISLAGLFVTALFQGIIVALSGSAGLLADAIHNAADAFTAVPLWVAFALARRPATRRYTYGYGRAEDIAGSIIVLTILLSALFAAYESAQKLLHPGPLCDTAWVMAAALVGFAGNEAVAAVRIRIGRQIASAALVADGQHARADGWTSLAVLLGALGSVLRFPLADPLVGLLITLAILFVVKDSAATMWRRLMDAVEPQQVDAVECVACAVPGVHGVHGVRLRWIGHTLHTELHITVDEDLSIWESHQLAEQVRHALFAAQANLATALVHVDLCGHGGMDGEAP